MKIAYHADTAIDAQLVADVLNGNDIFAQVRGAQMQGAVGEAAAMGNVKVWVHDGYIDQAKAIIEEWNQSGFVNEEDEELFKENSTLNDLEHISQSENSESHLVRNVFFVVAIVLLILAATIEF